MCHCKAKGIFVTIAEETGLEDKGEDGIVSGRLESEFLDDAGVMHVERIEPVVRFLKERLSLELCKRTHIDVSAFQL